MERGSTSSREVFKKRHRLEHWYRNNSLYFLTVSCTDKFHAFAYPCAQEIFWHQLDRYAKDYGFELFICTLMHNHYHAIGYMFDGQHLAPMLQRFHGATSKLVNDLLPQRKVPFFDSYFDGCLRNEKQYRRAYRYTQLQSVRHRICTDWRDYQNTRVSISLEDGLNLARTRKVYLPMVPYKRYERGRGSRGS